MSERYKIVRFYFNHGRRVVKRGLTREQAMKHCNDPETSSSTCKLPHNRRRTRKLGAWFDGFESY